MLSKKGKNLFTVVSLISSVGCFVALYLGYYFFHDRAVVYWVYNIYILILLWIVLFLYYRYLKMYVE